MKKFTKLLGIVLIIALVMSMGTAAFAADTTGRLGDNTGKVTIDNPEDGEIYTIYQLLTLASFADDDVAQAAHSGDRYSYVIETDSAWLSFIETYADTVGKKAFTVDKDNPVTIGNKTYYNVSVKDNFFGDPKTAEAYDEEYAAENAEYRVSGSKVQAFAQAALKYAKDNNVDNQGSKKAEGANLTDGKLVFSGLPLGYYLIDSTLGTLVTLDTTNNDVTVKDKNLKPTIEKKVHKNGAEGRDTTSNKYPTGVLVENTDHDIGDTVTFVTTVKARQNGHNYKLHDTMEEGLTYVKNSIVVYYEDSNGNMIMASATGEKPDYVVKERGTDARLSDGCDFEIEFKDSFLDKLLYATTGENAYQANIEVEYKAVLNEKAVVKGDTETASGPATTVEPIETGDTTPTATVNQLSNVDHNTDGRNTNSTILTFGTGSSTEWDNATVETYTFDIVKTKDKTSTTSTVYELLKDAEFKLYRADQVNTDGKLKDGATALHFALDSTTVQGSDIYRLKNITTETLSKGKTESAATDDDKIISVDSKKLVIKGLEAGVYYLDETKAPFGYNKLNGLIKVEIVAPADDTSRETIKVTMPAKNSQTVTGSVTATIATADGKTTYDSTNNGGLQIINKTGTELPSTGGIGTTIFYVVGSILVVAAGVLLITKKRMSREG